MWGTAEVHSKIRYSNPHVEAPIKERGNHAQRLKKANTGKKGEMGMVLLRTKPIIEQAISKKDAKLKKKKKHENSRNIQRKRRVSGWRGYCTPSK